MPAARNASPTRGAVNTKAVAGLPVAPAPLSELRDVEPTDDDDLFVGRASNTARTAA